MVWCYQLCEHRDGHNSHCLKTVGLGDLFPDLERSTQSFRIYSAVNQGTRARALTWAPDILEFCGCSGAPYDWQGGVSRTHGLLRYNASRDLIYICKNKEIGTTEAIALPQAPHIGICNGEKRTFQQGRLGPRHVAIERYEYYTSPAKLAEALSYMFPGCHTFYYGWWPHHIEEGYTWAPLMFTFEKGILEEVAWLADSRVIRITGDAPYMPGHWDENGKRFRFSWCWVNAELHPHFADSLPYRHFATARELDDEMTLAKELRRRSFNTSYMMRICDYDASDDNHGLGLATFDMIVQRVKEPPDTTVMQ